LMRHWHAWTSMSVSLNAKTTNLSAKTTASARRWGWVHLTTLTAAVARMAGKAITAKRKLILATLTRVMVTERARKMAMGSAAHAPRIRTRTNLGMALRARHRRTCAAPCSRPWVRAAAPMLAPVTTWIRPLMRVRATFVHVSVAWMRAQTAGVALAISGHIHPITQMHPPGRRQTRAPGLRFASTLRITLATLLSFGQGIR
jgi:hypothetical protein